MKKTILITGANRGIGLGLVEQFAKAGAKVYAGHRPESDVEALEALQEENSSVIPIELDVDDEDSVVAAAKQLAAGKVALDLLVNNAAVFPEEGNGPLSEIDYWALKEAFEVNVLGPMRVTQACIPLLRAGKEGASVAYITSGMGSLKEKVTTLAYAYSISKAALNKAVRILAEDSELEGIAQVLYTPGWVKTEMGGEEAELSLEECVVPLAKTLLDIKPKQNGQWLDRFGKATEFAW